MGSLPTLDCGCVAIDDILRMSIGVQPIEKALDPLDANDFLALSAQLGAKLNGVSEPLQREAISAALKTLDVDWPKLSNAARSRVVREANKQMLFVGVNRIAPKVVAEMKLAGKKIGPAAKEAAVAQFDLPIRANFLAEDSRVAQFALQSQANFITNALGQRIDAQSLAVREIVAGGLKRGLGRQELAGIIRSKLEAEGIANLRSKFYFEVVAGSFINRSRTYASIAAFQQAGVEFYIWDSVLDEATTETCRFMHNKRFPVAGAMKTIEQVGAAKSPEEIKEIQPWVRDATDDEGNPILVSGTGDDREVIATVTEPAKGELDKVGEYNAKFNDAQLMGKGISLPPIHGLCRSTVLADKTSTTVQVPAGAKPVAPAKVPAMVKKPDPAAKFAKAQALATKKLGKFPANAWGDGVTHPFPFDEDMPWAEEWAVSDVWQFHEEGKWKLRKPKKEDVFFGESDVSPNGVLELIKDKAKLEAAAKEIKMVKWGGKFYIIEGNEAAAAQRLLGFRRIEGRVVDLAKMKKPKPKVPLVKPPKAKPTAPKPPPPTKKPHEVILHERTGAARGSNEGGFYRGSDGVNRYVKFYDDPTQARSEHLANEIYRKLGLQAPKSQVFEMPDGRVGYASEIFEGGKTLQSAGLNATNAKKAMDGFVADVLTGNWDAAGLSLDNMMMLPNGKLARIDNGGTFLFRAQHGRKPSSVLNAITEWEKFLDGSTNPAYAKLANKAGFDVIKSRNKVIKQIDEVVKLRKASGGWAKLVDDIAPGLKAADKRAIVDMLDKRSDLLVEQRKKLKAWKPPPKPKPGEAKFLIPTQSKQGFKKGLRFEDLPEVDLKDVAPHYKRSSADSLPHGESVRDYRKRVGEQLKKLPATQSSAITRFTGSDYGEIRRVEAKVHRGEELFGSEQRTKRLSDNIKKGLEKMQPEPGTVYRGIRNLDRAVIDSFLETETFMLGRNGVPATSSATWEARVAVDNFMGGADDSYNYKVLYKMNGKTQVGIETISNYDTERETLFKRDATFRVTGFSRMKGKKKILIIECEEVVGVAKAALAGQPIAVVDFEAGTVTKAIFEIDGVLVIRGVEIDEFFPETVVVVSRSGDRREIPVAEVDKLPTEMLGAIEVDHPVLGLHRPWRWTWEAQ